MLEFLVGEDNFARSHAAMEPTGKSFSVPRNSPTGAVRKCPVPLGRSAFADCSLLRNQPAHSRRKLKDKGRQNQSQQRHGQRGVEHRRPNTPRRTETFFTRKARIAERRETSHTQRARGRRDQMREQCRACVCSGRGIMACHPFQAAARQAWLTTCAGPRGSERSCGPSVPGLCGPKHGYRPCPSRAVRRSRRRSGQ